MLEANLDDLNPQVFGYVVDRLFAEGALDVFAAAGADEEEPPRNVADSSVETRRRGATDRDHFYGDEHAGRAPREEQRQTLARNWITVGTRWGDVRLKIASMNGTVTNYAPEYEDCRKIAAQHHVPLKSVMQEAMQGYLKRRRE